LGLTLTPKIRCYVPDEILNRSYDCALEIYGTNKDLYEGDRKQPDAALNIQQIMEGKMGEWAVWYQLNGLGLKISFPDFSTHQQDKKSYGADLLLELPFNGKVRKVQLHVKTQDEQSEMDWGRSWTFGKNDPLIKRDHSLSNHHAAFCTLYPPISGSPYLIETAAILHVRFLMWEEVKRIDLRDGKKAIYWDSLSKLKDKELWSLGEFAPQLDRLIKLDRSCS
jgi:hypothetical protein